MVGLVKAFLRRKNYKRLVRISIAFKGLDKVQNSYDIRIVGVNVGPYKICIPI